MRKRANRSVRPEVPELAPGSKTGGRPRVVGAKERVRQQVAKRERYATDRRERERSQATRATLIVLGLCAGLLALMAATRDHPWWDRPAPMLLVMGGFGAFFTSSGLWSLRQQRRTHRWPSANAVVDLTDIGVTTSQGWTWYTPLVYYKYEVDGRSYTSELIKLETPSTTDVNKASKPLAAYKEGSKVRCCYDPARPERAVLERGVSSMVPMLLIGLGAVLIATALVFGFVS